MEPDSFDRRIHPLRKRIRSIFEKYGWKKALITVVLVVAGLVAFLADWTTFRSNITDSQAPGSATNPSISVPENSSTQTSEQSKPPTTPSSTEPQGAPEVGCFLRKSDALQWTACDSPHNAEIFPSQQTCDQHVVFDYLGGTPTIDVLRRDLQIEERSGVGCLLEFPGDVELTGSLKNALIGKESDFVRQCYDGRNDRYVSCDKIHTAEVVRTVSAESSEEARCTEAAEVYLGLSLTGFGDQLAVETRETNQFKQCLVKVKGDNVLTATLRNITHSSLPVTADDGRVE